MNINDLQEAQVQFENRQYKLIGLPSYTEEARLTELETEFLKLNPK